MPHGPVHQVNRSACQADFTYTMTVKTKTIQDTGKGRKSVADDLQAVLRKIEEWHQGSIANFLISYWDTHGAWHQLSWDGKEATVRETASGH
jgi:hypothetical protein